MTEAARNAADESARTEMLIPLVDLAAQFREIADDIHEAIEKVFCEQQFILGDEVAALECELAEYCDSLQAVGCASGTDALILSLMALDIGRGDEVITSPLTSVATAEAIVRVGARPVFVDVDPVSFTLDAGQVEAAVTSRTRAILPVHLFGQCAEMEPLFRIAVRKRLAVIEDACQALGAEYHGRRAGVLGTVGCFSFSPTMNLGGAGDGGMLTTDDALLAARLRRLRQHGDNGEGTYTEIGLGSRLDALQAAVLRVKRGCLDDWTEARETNARRYRELFRHYGLLGAVEPPEALPGRRHVYQQFCVRIRGGQRDDVRSYLRAERIGTAVPCPIPLHLQPAFAFLQHQRGDFPEAESAAEEMLALPVFPELQAVQQEMIVRHMLAALGCSAETERRRAA